MRDNQETYTEQDYIRETKQHIELVQKYMDEFSCGLKHRADVHDASKLEDPEKRIFIEHTPAFKEITFGTPEHKAHLKKVQVALDHHYANNRHHPEWHEDGVRGMNLLDIVEMFVDWKASSEKYDGDLERSIRVSQERFGFSDELMQIFLNSIDLFDKK